jgi:predicted ribosome quality control (RQC) complex YloA/Tae2 family protein
LELAKQFGVKRFSTSGCYLTNPCFSRRLRDAIKHKDLTISDIHLLKMGRHFRVSRKVKVIIGRNKDENKRLPTFLQPGDLLIWPEHHKGATAILNGEIDKEVDILKVAALCARYSEGKNLPSVKMNIKFSKKTREVAVVKPKDASSLSFAMI